MDEITVLVHIRAISALPATGFDVATPLLVALALCAVGTLLVTTARVAPSAGCTPSLIE
ncbi:hypothetical protein HQQ81_02315 [Microbacteriaceae bacterium VKM Ac-2854]|nr:hypothetical protein [Microbacteriaceae bacterium VKM Ac-2854]